MKKLLLIVILACISSVTFAQRHSKNAKFGQWMDDMRQVKVEYVAKELNLNPQQKEKFAPIYDAMNKEIGKLTHETRSLEKSVRAKGSAATDLEYDKATEAMVELKGKESAIEKKYYGQLKSVLTKQQLFNLPKAERKFTRELMKQRRACKNNKR
ncbi:MAG: Spy/CpxP family protein refolding chaperone [Paramuribaculum sp.]|nr:Spy/CpxP family protein refolding chaperone [Paramuribaculum sp.]